MSTLTEYLEIYTYEYLLETALARIPDTIDKREGSIIYDALAPACLELSDFYMQLKNAIDQSSATTATGQALDYKVAEQGLTRLEATYAVRKGVFTKNDATPFDTLPLGSRFSTTNDAEGVIFVVTDYFYENDVIVPGSYQLTCEQAGAIGNDYIGNLIPVSYINDLATATLTDILVTSQDVESDDDLRARYFEYLKAKAFAGNVADYRRKVSEIAGVGNLQVYPIWNGGGTVKLSVVDDNYNPITPTFITQLKDLIDPANGSGVYGYGLGLAPIGHNVTVVAPTEVTVNVASTVVYSAGANKPAVDANVTTAIEEYFLQLRKQWGVSNDLNEYSIGVYLAKINAIIIGVSGIENVIGTTLNGASSDITLTQNATTQELPQLGTVVLSE